MKEYYDILDVPLTATPDEIKAQYRQLVRVYHPDRFRNQDDKAYAEEKLKQINIAFQVLSGTSVRRGPFEARVAPQPVAYPPVLDFGTLQIGQREKLKLQVGNIGGDAEKVGYVYSNNNPWFKLSKGKQVYADQPFPIDFEVAVDTRRLKPEQTYQEWIEVVLDGIAVRVDIQVKTVAHRRALMGPNPIGWSALAALLLFAILFLPSFLGISLPATLLPGALLSAGPGYELRTNEMIFSVNNGSASTLFVGLGADSVPRELGFIGKEAVGTQAGQRIAFLRETTGLDKTSGPAQIFLFDLAAGETKQLTRDLAEKSKLAWSPDGLRLGYLTGSGDKQRIGIYNVRTGQEYLLPGEVSAGVEHFVWSPDGNVLLFDLWQGEEQRVYRIGVQGNDLRQLTHFDSWAGAWSPDGAHILVGTDHGLYRLASTGQQLQQLTDVAAQQVRWSADGQWIAYTTAGLDEHTDKMVTTVGAQAATSTESTKEILWLVDRYGHDAQQITDELLWYQWSPEGSTLAYTTGNSTSADAIFYLWTLGIATDASQSPTLVAEVNDRFFAWPR